MEIKVAEPWVIEDFDVRTSAKEREDKKRRMGAPPYFAAKSPVRELGERGNKRLNDGRHRLLLSLLLQWRRQLRWSEFVM